MRKNTLPSLLLLGAVFLGPLSGLAQAESAAAPARMLLMDLRATLIEEDVVRLVNNMLTTELALHEEFELIKDPVKEDNELIEEPDKELKNEQSGGGSMDNIKKVVISFF